MDPDILCASQRLADFISTHGIRVDPDNVLPLKLTGITISTYGIDVSPSMPASVFQPTGSAWIPTGRASPRSRRPANFNPRDSRGSRPLVAARRWWSHDHFNPRDPRGSRLPQIAAIISPVIISTHGIRVDPDTHACAYCFVKRKYI